MRGIVAMLFLASTSALMAAQDGERGPQSSGLLSISIQIDEALQILGLEDLDLTVSRDTQSELTIVREFCIRAAPNTRFALTTWTDVLSNGRLALVGESGELLPFRVDFTPSANSQVFDEITPNSQSTPFVIGDAVDCTTGNNAQIRVVFSPQDILSSIDANFTGDLYISIELV